MEKEEWKPFRNALNNKKERKEFDDMFDIPRSYLPACSNSVSLVPLQPIMISILFHHYTQLMELKAEVEQIKSGGEQPKEVVVGGGEENLANNNTKTLDRYFIINNNNNNRRQ